MSELVKVGKYELSLRHLSIFKIEELERLVKDRKVAEELLEKAKTAVYVSMIRPTILKIKNLEYYFPVGVSLVVDRYNVLDYEPKPFSVPDYIDKDFLEYLAFKLPKKLDTFRTPVYVPDVDDRFTKHVREGVVYAADIMERIGRAYQVQIICTGSLILKDYWSWGSIVHVYRKPDIGMICAVLKPSYAVYKV